MKSSIVGIFVVSMITVLLGIGFMVQTNANIKDEAIKTCENALMSAEQSLLDQRDNIKSNDEFIDEFCNDLQIALNDSEGTIYDVNIYGVDYQKGLLSAEVIVKYKNILNVNQSIKVRRTILLDGK